MIQAIGTLMVRFLALSSGTGAFGFSPRGAGSAADPNAAMIALMIVSGLGAAGLAWVVVTAIRRDRARHGPAVRRLAAGLGLSASARVLLCRVARAADMPSAGSMMISRGCFDAAMKRYAPHGREAQRLRMIRRTLFD